MSVHSTIKCDRCRSVVTDDRTELEVLSGRLRSRFESIDLCPTCCAALERFFDSADFARPPLRNAVKTG